MRLKTNILLIIFVLLTSFNYNVRAENLKMLQYKDSIKIPTYTSISYGTEIKKIKNNRRNSNFKATKKDLKTEIKQRKKYHKSLLSVYNESFNPEYLNLIELNSKRLTTLRKLL